jgi:hypothetical protein
MAKFISSLITEASGSVAGTTYSRNKNGSYIRNKSVPVNRNTLAQQAARARFSEVSSSWKGLDANERATWENNIMQYPYVDSLGQTKYYTASQLYKSINNSLFQVGLTPISSLPSPISMPTIISGEVIVDQSAKQIYINEISFGSFGNNTVPVGFSLLIYATTIRGAGFSAPKNSDYRFIDKIDASVDATSIQQAQFYDAVFGDSWANAENENNTIYFGFKMVAVSTGQRNNAYFSVPANIDA